MSKDLRVSRRLARPRLPQLVAHGIHHEVLLRPLAGVIHAHVRRLGIGIIRRVEVLRGGKAKMLAPEQAAERSSMAARAEGSAIHDRVEEIAVLHDDGEFGVVEPQLGAVVDVRGAAERDAVVDDHHFAVDVQFLLHEVFLFALQVVA